jgi:hypothetical protein
LWSAFVAESRGFAKPLSCGYSSLSLPKSDYELIDVLPNLEVVFSVAVVTIK